MQRAEVVPSHGQLGREGQAAASSDQIIVDSLQSTSFWNILDPIQTNCDPAVMHSPSTHAQKVLKLVLENGWLRASDLELA